MVEGQGFTGGGNVWFDLFGRGASGARSRSTRFSGVILSEELKYLLFRVSS